MKSNVAHIGRPEATGIYATREELERHVKMFFLMFPHGHQHVCAKLTGTSVATVNRIVNQ